MAQPLALLQAPDWQMRLGERAALEGVLAQVSPRLAIEIGTAAGGSLDRIAAYSDEVHSFDLVEPSRDPAGYPNVTFHTGDSHELLPRFLSELDAGGREADFVLVDGDHTADGVRRDVEDVIGAKAAANATVLLHDTMNELVREGIEQALSEPPPHVVHVDLDLVAGYLVRSGPFRHDLWGGVGLIVCDAAGVTGYTERVADERYGAFALLSPLHDAVIEREATGRELTEDEVIDLAFPSKAAAEMAPSSPSAPTQDAADTEATRAELDSARAAAARAQATTAAIAGSKSWRLTAPLRALRREAVRRRRP